MSKRGPIDVNSVKVATKKLKSREGDDDDNQSAVVDDVVSRAVEENSSSSADIFSLNLDCFEKVFDYLTLKDLVAVFNSCKRMQPIAGHCFKLNYASVVVDCRFGAIFYQHKLNSFSPYVRKLMVNSKVYFQWHHRDPFYNSDDYHRWNALYLARKNEFRFPGPVDANSVALIQSHRFDSIEEIELKRLELTNSMKCIKEILERVEVVKLTRCTLDGEFHDDFLVFCKQMKRLCFEWLQSDVSIIGVNNNWLQRSYPKLEQLEIVAGSSDSVVPNLAKFLQQNPNIKTFAADDGLIRSNAESMLNGEVKLNVLAVHLKESPKNLYDLLDKLYERGFYERLHLYCIRVNQEFINGIASAKGLVKLYVSSVQEAIDFSSFTGLNELCVPNGRDILNLKQTATSLVNLRQLHFTHRAKYSQISTFIEHSAKLTKIKVNQLIRERRLPPTCFNGNVINLGEWNDKRKQLNDPRKVSIFVAETVYLATKCKLNENNFDLVELKREESSKWSHEFGY